jgi:glycosyltransferase involved in cell wall biosynthesis
MSRHYLQLPFEDTKFIRTYDAASLVKFVRRRLSKSVIPATHFLCGIHCDLGLNRADLLHHFNLLSFASTPYVVTFEDYLPRWNSKSALGMRLMAGKQCRRLIAMSRWSYDEQVACLEDFPDVKDAITEKMTILHPVQATRSAHFPPRPPIDGELRFALVGREFFLKGGMETLRAFERLSNEGYPVKLTLVSPLTHGDYITKSTPEDTESARALISKLHRCVTHYERLDNDKVLQLFSESHVSLLPTMNDTYGFVVLESQAAGCPVISTDSCVLPEINDDSQGWLITVPKDANRTALHSSAQELRQLSETIEEGVYATIRRIFADPSTINLKAERAFQRVREQHDPVMIARRQEEIYREALRKDRARVPNVAGPQHLSS